jgi:uncharacterized protein (TIGR02266 family)
VSDMLTTARSARESLARGLNALQAGPNVPSQLLEAAAPIAQAMGALHQIEQSRGSQLQPHATTALSHVRMALSQLQAEPSAHPAVVQALEAVAGSLGLVNALTQGTAPAAAGPPPVPAPIPAPIPAQAQSATAFAATVAQPAIPAIPPMAVPRPAPHAAAIPPMPPQAAPPIPPTPHAAPPMPPQAQPRAAAPPAIPAPQAPMAPPQPPPPPPMAVVPPAQPVFQPPPAPAGPIPSPAAASGVPVIEAPLGAHSPTNFYKGLSGNDIVDHGGLFVSTYKIPKLGTSVRLKVSLPGGYEFEANGVVRWSREASEGGGHDAPPGFGAQFTQITAEARQLIYRYVRNREPLFHDDL